MSAAKLNTSLANYEYESGNLLQNKTLDTNPSTGEFIIVDPLSTPFGVDKSTNFHNSYLKKVAGNNVPHASSMQILPSSIDDNEGRYQGCGHQPTPLKRGKNNSQLRSQADFVSFIQNTSKIIS